MTHRRRWLFLGFALLVLAAAGWHYWTLYRSFSGARDNLLAAQSRLNAAGLNLTREDLDRADGDLRAAGADARNARRHFDWDPLARGAAFVPGLRGQVDAVDDFLTIAGLLIATGHDASTAGRKALAVREAPPAGQPLTRSLVDLINDAGPDLERVTADVRAIVALRREMGDAALLPPLARARDRLDKELPRIADAVEAVNQSKALLPGFLGFAGARRYLVFAVNNGELLPGGGLVTASGVLPIKDGVNGAMDFVDSVLWKDTWEAKGGKYIEPPGPLKRYLLRDYTWNLLVSNWDPDFPTWAQQAMEFHALINGPQKVDGIIAIDLDVFPRLLRITGPKTLAVPGRGNVTFNEDNAVIELERLTRNAFAPGADRKSVIGDLAELMMADLLKLPSDKWADAVDVMRDLGSERHIQILSFNAEEQTILRDVRWDGRIVRTDGDYLQLNEASLRSTKLNLIIEPEASYTIDVDELGTARHVLKVTYYNPLPEWAKTQDKQLVADLMLEGVYGGYLRVFTPKGTTAFDVQRDGKPNGVEDSADYGATLQWKGTYMPLKPGDTTQMTFKWNVPFATRARAAATYELFIQKQPGTEGMCMDINVVRGGKPASSVTIKGGHRDEKGRVCLVTDVTVLATF